MPQLPDDAKPALDVLRSVGGDELLRAMLATFLQFADAQLAKLEASARAGQLEEAAGIAHSVKSSARQLGAMALGDACAAVELAGKGGDAAGVLTGVAAVSREYAIARGWMGALAGV